MSKANETARKEHTRAESRIAKRTAQGMDEGGFELTPEEKYLISKAIQVIFDSDEIMESNIFPEEEFNQLAALRDRLG